MTDNLSSAIDLTVSLVKNDINKLINLHMLASNVKICENNVGAIIKLLSMIFVKVGGNDNQNSASYSPPSCFNHMYL